MSTSASSPDTFLSADATAHAMSGQGGMYVVSLRREADREAMRVAAYQLVGFFDPAVALPYSFVDAGYSEPDVVALIDGLHFLAIDPQSSPNDPWAPNGDKGGTDSEDRPTDSYMITVGGETGANWLACAEAAHAAWPTLFDTLGASIGGVVITGSDTDGTAAKTRTITVPETRVPKLLRLKAGWDYDENGEQVQLPLEEAWDRFTAHVSARRERRGADYMDAKTMRKMRRHMVGGYARRAREQRAADLKGFAKAIAPVMAAGVVGTAAMAAATVAVAKYALRRRG